MLALPPLSPLRAPATVPSGSRRVGPGGSGSGSSGSPAGARTRVRSGSGTVTCSPPGSTAVCVTWSRSTTTASKTPYGEPLPGGAVRWKPGYPASASSTAAPLTARPTFPASGSRTTSRSSALAVSSVAASAWSVRASSQRASAGPAAASASPICALTSSALASMSSPVSTKTTSLRHPPSRVSPALRVGGGASPRTPSTRTRSGPCWPRRTVSRRAVTSGPAYRGPLVS